MMLEIIWSKISLYFDVSMPWKETLKTENLSPLLTAIGRKEGNQVGWCFRTIEPSEKLLQREEKVQWTPSFLSEAAITLTNLMLIRGGQFDIYESSGWLEDKFGTTFGEVTEELLSSGYFMDDNGLIRPIETVSYIATFNDNSGVIATDRKLLDLWLSERKQEFVISVFVFI